MAAEPGPDPGPNPFSFHEFVRSQARGARGGLLPAPGDEEEQEEDEEEEWGGSYRPCAVERAHLAAGPFCEGPLGASPPPPGYEELKEENASLRSRINKLQILSETQADKMRKLERKLEENKIKEEKETQDLEAMVQHVEQNLQLMTVQLNNYKAENEALRSGQSASLAAVKQNAEVAFQNLLTVIANSRSAVRQLVLGAESLQLVADLLKSIDSISEVPEDGQ
ncbi:endosome-associated-trafficking regulator 1 [Aythya fuligula]|uniref:Endosome-associated-trafficking regulator 1 n=1 Tax=Aythya fuligula TaxID=219594 RepID=A0A6J3DZS2_AYTFU|nr:endosome-associated-trafficking regulator 1 [Aythya fuligula]